MIWEVITILVIGVAFLFLLTNGLHDASSVVATMIGCGAALPLQAVIFAAFLELLGAMLGGSAVAYTIAKMIEVPPGNMLLLILLVALIAATAWNVFTWQLGLPSSSTHALIGGLIGAVCIATGPSDIVWGISELFSVQPEVTGVVKVIVGLIISPVIGFGVAFMAQRIIDGALKNKNYSTTNNVLKRLQWIVVGILAYSHGANDTQKIMGIVILALMAAGNTSADSLDIPMWLRLAVGIIMFIGILCGGWTIMKTLGRGIYALRPLHSFNSLFSSGLSLLGATVMGAPASTTHLVVGSIIGVGAADEYKMVNWKIGKAMLIAWCVTIPATAICAALLYIPLRWLVMQIMNGVM